MSNYGYLVGKQCDWKILKTMKHDWQLSCDNRVVATLKAKRWLSNSYEGSIENTNVDIVYSRPNDSSVITNASTSQTIGVVEGLMRCNIEGMRLPPPAIFKTGSKEYPIIVKKNIGYVISTTDKVDLAATLFDNRSMLVRSNFTLLSNDDIPFSPWLLALVGQYYAIHHSY